MKDSLELASLASSEDADGSQNEWSRQSPRESSSGRGDERASLSAFDLEDHLLPLSSTHEDGNGAHAAGGLEKFKHVGFLSGFGFVVSLQVGGGIFSTPSRVNVHVGSVGASLVVWLVSGILVWTGASSYAELGGAIPLNGGEQAYLQHIYGDLAGFLYSFTAVLVLKPSSAAIISMICADYVNRASFADPQPWVSKGIAIVVIVLVSAINVVGARSATRTNNVLLFVKLSAILGVTVAGLVVMASGRGQQWTAGIWTNTATNGGEWAIALYAGLWAFDGWNNANFIVAELRNAKRDLPRIVHSAMPTVILAYILANIAFFSVLTLEEIDSNDAIALAFGRAILGGLGGTLLAIAVALSCLGALNSTVFTAARLVHASAKQGYLPPFFAALSRWNTPMRAVLLQMVLAMVYIIVGTFEPLVTFYGVAGYFFYFFTVLAVLVLRFTRPELERPYRTWITTPIIFCCVALFLLTRGVFSAPVEALCAGAFILLGVPIYYFRMSYGF